MNRKNENVTILALLIVVIIRFINIENIPFEAIVCIAGCCIALAIFSVTRYKGNKKEKNCLLITIILLIIMALLILTEEYLKRYYPYLLIKCDSMILIFMGITFLCLLIVIIINSIYKHKCR